MHFAEIMNKVATGEFDAGVIIHESRFTYSDYNLRCLADLGQVWEQATDLPLPLGVIAATTQLADRQINAIEEGLQTSIQVAWAESAGPWPYIRSHAQEMSEEVCRQHIQLYVNSYSHDLGVEGQAAIEELLKRGGQLGIFPS